MRRVAVATTLVGLIALIVLGVIFIPWQPVPGGAPAPAEASELFTADQQRRGEDFGRLTRILSTISLIVSLAFGAWLALAARGRRLLERTAGRLPGPWQLQAAATVVVVLLVGRLVMLPLTLWRHSLLIDYGLTRQSLPAWGVDQLRGLGVGILFTSIGVVALIGCARRWRTWWPAIASTVAAALVMAGSFLYPLLVEPVFNDFESMPDGSMREQILELADQEGVAVDDVLVSDASRRTTTLNAYVSGFGGTRRVVIYDNLVKDLPREQVLSVVAHELAHARHNDVLIGTAMGAAGAVTGVGLLGVLVSSGGVRRRAAVTGMADPRVVALVMVLASAGQVLASPVENLVSRTIETRADVDALQSTQDPDSLIALQRELCVRSVCDPTPPPAWQWWWGSHPTVVERVAIARQITDE